MGLAIYDDSQTLFAGTPFRAVINGHAGGSHEEKIYIRNDDVTKWYTNITASVVGSAYDALGALGVSGISFKYIYGERRPTEAEWDLVRSGATVVLPDIGTSALADTSTYHPVWIRIYVPGNTGADIIDTYTIRITALPRVVGV